MLAEEFGIGGYSHTFSDGVQGWVDFNGKGLRLRTGETQLNLSWAKAGDRIRTLIRDGYYLTGEEKDGYDAWLEQEHPGEHEPEQISITDLPTAPSVPRRIITSPVITLSAHPVSATSATWPPSGCCTHWRLRIVRQCRKNKPYWRNMSAGVVWPTALMSGTAVIWS